MSYGSETKYVTTVEHISPGLSSPRPDTCSTKNAQYTQNKSNVPWGQRWTSVARLSFPLHGTYARHKTTPKTRRTHHGPCTCGRTHHGSMSMRTAHYSKRQVQPQDHKHKIHTMSEAAFTHVLCINKQSKQRTYHEQAQRKNRSQ